MTNFPSPFYRVTAKALVFDSQQRLLVVQNHNGNWELPGGGWEHDESFVDALKREIYEELCVPVAHVGDVAFMYRGRNLKRGFMTLRLAAPVTLAATDFIIGTDMRDVRYVSRDEFDLLDFTLNEGEVDADRIWPSQL